MLNIAIAPIIILLFYIYIKDKYEKEPYMMLIVGIIVGAIITPVIFFIEDGMINIPMGNELTESLYISFIVAGLTEELVKFIFIYALAYNNREFNEPFDGIVYGTFIALGFAMIENIMYVTNSELGGITTGIARSVTSIPVHAMYGVIMGYYLGKAKFPEKKKEKNTNMLLSITIPILFHGIYDFVLVYPPLIATYAFLLVILVMINISYRMMKSSLKTSPFKSIYNYNKYRELKKDFDTMNGGDR